MYDRHVIPTVFFRTTETKNRVERASAVRELFLLDGDAEDGGWQERALCAQTDP